MFARTSLHSKIMPGFAVLLVISTTLGLLSTWSMKGVKAQSRSLSTEYMPETKLSSDLAQWLPAQGRNPKAGAGVVQFAVTSTTTPFAGREVLFWNESPRGPAFVLQLATNEQESKLLA